MLPRVWATGLTTVQGCGFGRDGSIYVSNCSIAPATGRGPKLCSSGGQVVRIG